MTKILAGIAFLILISIQLKAQPFTQLKDINPTPGYYGSNPYNLIDINGTLFFTANDGVNGYELWKSDGTAAGTILVKDINIGSGNSDISYMTNVNGTLFFSARNGANGNELWKSDGTAAGTILVKDINIGVNDAFPDYLTNFNGILFFTASDGIIGTELWKSDGTAVGTVLVKDIFEEAIGSAPSGLTILNGSLLFSATDPANGSELWKSNGTEAGTVLVKDIYTGPAGSGPANLTNVNGTLFFSTHKGNGLSELWKSDGTATGTTFIKEIYIDATGAIPFFTNVNGTLFFVAFDVVNGNELWKSDGTTTGTMMVKDIFVGTSSSYAQGLTNVNGTLFFNATDGAHGSELWKSNGTTAGTLLVRDITAGTGSGLINNTFVAIGNMLLFSADDGIHGEEFWQSNGKAAGTTMLQDIAAGSVSSRPARITKAGNYIFLTAYSEEYGIELNAGFDGLTLPLSLLNFSGHLQNSDGILNWKTTKEQNTDVFEIERSIDGSSYVKVGTVAAAGRSSSDKSYTFNDQNVAAHALSVVYYRLKMKDVDGRSTYSGIVACRIDGKGVKLVFYPNPVKDMATVMISLDKTERINYRITDYTGRILRSEVVNLAAGAATFNIDTKGLAAGAYYLSIQGERTKEKIQFIKQ